MSSIALFANEATPIDVEALRSVVGDDVALVTPPAECMQIPMDREAEACLADIVRDVDAIFFRVGEVTGPVIEAARRLRIIAVHGVGTDSVDIETASARQVYVTITPGANAIAVVEYIVSMLLLAERRLDQSMTLFRTEGWYAGRIVGQELHGKHLGIVGYGAVGSRLASVANAMGMQVLLADHPSITDCPFPRVPLAELIRSVDAIVLTLPRRSSTIGLISDQLLRTVKPGAVLVNTSRADIVDETSLLRALDDGVLAWAALDVFGSEPTALDHPLVTHPRVLATPHMAGSTPESLARIARAAGDDIRRVLDNGTPLHAVNLVGGMTPRA